MISKQLCNVGFYSNVRYEFCTIQLAWIDCDNVNVHRAVPTKESSCSKGNKTDKEIRNDYASARFSHTPCIP